MRQRATVLEADARARAWELHVRGWAFSAIGRELGLHRVTVSRYVKQVYRELGHDRREALERALDEAIARLRAVQAQAWADHDADDRREVAALASIGVALDGRAAASELTDGRRRVSGVRFGSQRAQYLRVILDCEREIARLRGLYGAAVVDDGAEFVFRIERVDAPDAAAGAGC